MTDPTPEEVASKIGGDKKKIPGGLAVLCPGHKDTKPSLDIIQKGDKTLFVCRAGCMQTEVLAALQAIGAWPKRNERRDEDDPRFVCAYDYVDENGKLLFQVVRKRNPKQFPQRRPDGIGGWIWKTEGVRKVLYRLPDLIEVKRQTTNGRSSRVFIVEGEKDADRLNQWGLLATTNPGGASKGKSKWRAEYNQYFSGFDVAIIPDNDAAGHTHANQVATHLAPVAASVRLVELPGQSDKGDVSDWIDAGGSQDELGRLVDSAKPFQPDPPPPPPPPKDWRSELITNKQDVPLALEINAMIAMRKHPDLIGLFAVDEFHQRPYLMRRPMWAREVGTFPRAVCDADLSNLLAWLQWQGIYLHGRTPVKIALASVVQDLTFHPVRDYLNKLEWDRIPRLDNWLTYYLGVEPIANYTSIAAVKWMLSAVARIYRPGCIAKYVLIIEGAQDLGKSHALRILGGEWFTDDIATLGSKDSQMQVGNAWIIELAELDSTRRADINTIKAFISRPIDQFRPPYGEHIIRQERQSVLAATVNPAGAYLHDETGAIRFWPVLATSIKLDALSNDRDQLWAEAVNRFKAGEQWWPNGDFKPTEQQEARSETAVSDPWFDPIVTWIERRKVLAAALKKKEWTNAAGIVQLHSDERYAENLKQAERLRVFSTSEALHGALEIPTERMDRKAERRLGSVLRYLGYTSGGVRIDKDVDPVRRWHKRHP